MKIEFFGLKRQYQNLREEILDATDKVYASGQMLDGANTQVFEQEIARRTDRKYAIAVSNCTQALQITYRLLKGENIVIPCFSFVATYDAVKLENKTPLVVDIDINGLLDLDQIIPNTADIISYVNLYGNILDYDKLRLIAGFFSNNTTIVEDAAQSFGGTYKGIPSGKLGDVSCLSFDPTKNLPCYGSGGMILTDGELFATACRRFRNHGKLNAGQGAMVGTNSKMNEADAAQMLVKLKYFDGWQKRRRLIAEYYTAQFKDLEPDLRLPTVSPDVVHAWHKYVIFADGNTARNAIRARLSELGIETKIHYDKFFGIPDGLKVKHGSLADNCISLPIYPEMTDAEVGYIAASVKHSI